MSSFYRVRLFFCCALSALFIASCASHLTPHQALEKQINRYSHSSDALLRPYFERANVAYPPQKITLIADKHDKTLSLWAKTFWGWAHIRDYPILAASGVLGPKLHEGDRQVPEGIYHPIELNPRSHFHLSIELNYPNRFDRLRALMDGRKDLGGQIFIHGGHRSVGCLAIGDRAIEELFVLVYRVGMKNVTVIITPNAKGSLSPRMARLKVSWLGLLYHRIGEALKMFYKRDLVKDLGQF